MCSSGSLGGRTVSSRKFIPQLTWPESTNVFHRWVARVATLQAIAHSAAYTWLTRTSLAESFKELYWVTGVVATVLMSLLVFPLSSFPLRTKLYELFLYIHIVLALITLVMLFYHVTIFDHQYDGWLWACVAIWVSRAVTHSAKLTSATALRPRSPSRPYSRPVLQDGPCWRHQLCRAHYAQRLGSDPPHRPLVHHIHPDTGQLLLPVHALALGPLGEPPVHARELGSYLVRHRSALHHRARGRRDQAAAPAH